MLEIDEARGNPLPEWATNAPTLLPGEAWFLKAFRNVSTERQRNGPSIGPIPWSKVIQYGDRSGLDAEAVDLLWTMVQALDLTYMEWYVDEVKTSKPRRETSDDDRE